MIKVEYKFKAKGPLHTGSDVNAGTCRSLRRQKCVLRNPSAYQSTLTEASSRDAVCAIALAVWFSIDKEHIKGTRMMGIWDEFSNKLQAAGRAEDKYKFLEYLYRSWGIESMNQPIVLKAIDALSDYELLDTVRNESMYVVLKTRYLRDQAKKDEIGPEKFVFDLEIKTQKPQSITRIEDHIPCISGNSFRGRMRRLVMLDFCKRVGIKKLEKRVYHTLFTGGFLDQSTQYEDFDRMEKFVSMCPMLGVLGAAIGNMTIEGEAKIGWAYPLCAERSTAEVSYWTYLDTVFQTRLDSSKQRKISSWSGKTRRSK